MSYNGLGTFLPLAPPTFPAVPGELIRADYFNAIIGDLINGLSAVMTRSGQAGMVGNLPMTGFKVTGSGLATAPEDLVRKDQLDAAVLPLSHLSDLRKNVLDFVTDEAVRTSILNGTCTTDLSTQLLAFRNALAASPVKITGYFPAGLYTYSASPNWAVDNLSIVSDGARFRYTGTGRAMIFDAVLVTASVGVTNFCYGVRWLGHTFIEAPGTALNCLYLRSIHHPIFENWNFRGCGSTASAILVQFSVCAIFINPVVSGNEGGWYLGAKPLKAVTLDSYPIGADPGQASYCLFLNPIFEGVTIGVELLDTLGNTFIGGTIEGCSDTGVLVQSSGTQDKFYGVDLEANTNHDFLIYGWGMTIDKCDTLKKITIPSGYDNQILGGRHMAIDCQAASHHNRFDHCVYDRLTTGATLGDSGTYNSFAGCKKPSSPFRGRPLTNVIVAATASPMTISNATGDPQYYTVSGGTVTGVFHARFGIGQAEGHYSGKEYLLLPGEDLVLVFTVAPAITAFK